MDSLKIVEIVDYWPEVVDDLSLVTWSHATNSHAELHQALVDGTMMIEADVSIGPDGQPIMAHPPAIVSDLSLQQFLDIVIAVSIKQVKSNYCFTMYTCIKETEKGTKKGIKLDFKSIDIVQPSLELMRTVESRLEIPVWLNADIIVGPAGGDPVDADRFLDLCAQYFPGEITWVSIVGPNT